MKPLSRYWHWVVLSILGLVVLLAPFPVKAAVPTEKTFRIDAKRFAYDPSVLKVNPGDRVTIELVATDVVHGLSVDGYNAEITADPGMTARLSFIADKQGVYRFRCITTCGNLHPFMVGKLEVGQNVLLWRAIVITGLALIAGAWKGRQ